MNAPPPDRPDAGDPAIAAIHALVAVCPHPLAVFDDTGVCLVANRDFILHAARVGPEGEAGETRTPFSPDGRRQWMLATIPPGAAVQQAGDFIDTLTNALPMMFNAKDRDSRYLLMNRYQARLYGVTPQAAIGRTAADLLGQEYGSYTRAIDAEVMRTGEPTPFYEEEYAGVDGIPRNWLTTKVPLASGTAQSWGVVTVAIDITERKALERGLQEARDQAEAANRAKSGFLATMSHELRTPLNAVIGFAEMIQNEVSGPTDPDTRSYAGHIRKSGEHLLTLINDLLDYARVEAGGLALDRAIVDLRGLLAAALDLLRPMAGAAGVGLSAEVPMEPLMIDADDQRIRHVLVNVIGNAVKFTLTGGAVRVALNRCGTAAEILVSDSGIGMSETDLGRVFEPFWQADQGLRRMRDGAGIGLPLARHLVALHGGSLELNSQLGQGTVVRIMLPAV